MTPTRKIRVKSRTAKRVASKSFRTKPRPVKRAVEVRRGLTGDWVIGEVRS